VLFINFIASVERAIKGIVRNEWELLQKSLSALPLHLYPDEWCKIREGCMRMSPFNVTLTPPRVY